MLTITDQQEKKEEKSVVSIFLIYPHIFRFKSAVCHMHVCLCWRCDTLRRVRVQLQIIEKKERGQYARDETLSPPSSTVSLRSYSRQRFFPPFLLCSLDWGVVSAPTSTSFGFTMHFPLLHLRITHTCTYARKNKNKNNKKPRKEAP
jgi:hypothetical protein